MSRKRDAKPWENSVFPQFGYFLTKLLIEGNWNLYFVLAQKKHFLVIFSQNQSSSTDNVVEASKQRGLVYKYLWDRVFIR